MQFVCIVCCCEIFHWLIANRELNPFLINKYVYMVQSRISMTFKSLCSGHGHWEKQRNTNLVTSVVGNVLTEGFEQRGLKTSLPQTKESSDEKCVLFMQFLISLIWEIWFPQVLKLVGFSTWRSLCLWPLCQWKPRYVLKIGTTSLRVIQGDYFVENNIIQAYTSPKI